MTAQAIVQASDVMDAQLICEQWRAHSDNQDVAQRLTIDYVASTRRKQDNDAVMQVCSEVGRCGCYLEHTCRDLQPFPIRRQRRNSVLVCLACRCACVDATARKALRTGELDIIVHVRMLGEGFDHKRLSVAVIMHKFGSLAPFCQFVGRAMRRDDTRPEGHKPPVMPHEQVCCPPPQVSVSMLQTDGSPRSVQGWHAARAARWHTS